MGHFRRKKRKQAFHFLQERKHFVLQNASQDLHVVSILQTLNYTTIFSKGFTCKVES
jgi:hypothetical protein